MADKYIVYSEEEGVIKEFEYGDSRDRAIAYAKKLLNEEFQEYCCDIPDEMTNNGYISVFKVEAESQVTREETIEQYEKRTGEVWTGNDDLASIVDIQMVDLETATDDVPYIHPSERS